MWSDTGVTTTRLGGRRGIHGLGDRRVRCQGRPRRNALRAAGRAARCSRERIEKSAAPSRREADESEALLGRVAATTEFDGLAGAEIVVEAVFEDVAGARLPAPRRASTSAIIASNTSSIPIAQLASWTKRRDRVLGQLLRPVPVMKLVEVVVGLETSAETVGRAEVRGRSAAADPDRDRRGSSSHAARPLPDGGGADARGGFATRRRSTTRACASAGTRWGRDALRLHRPTSSTRSRDSLYEVQAPRARAAAALKRMVVPASTAGRPMHSTYA